jgi:hypothetical protein
LLQPSRHGFELGGGTSETAHRFIVSGGRHGYVVGFVADVNAGSMGMHHLQTEVFRLDFSRHLPSLRAVHFVPTDELPATPNTLRFCWCSSLCALS